MNKHEWYGLTPAEREALVLELLGQGYTADQLNDYFEVRSKRVINDFMNGRGYSKRNNTFVPKDGTSFKPIAKDNIATELKEENQKLLEQQQELLNIINEYKEKEDKQLDQNNKMLDIIKDYQIKETNTQNQLVSIMNNDRDQNERVLSIIEYYMSKTVEIENKNNTKLIESEIAMTQERPEPDYDVEIIDTSLPVKNYEETATRTTIRVHKPLMDEFNSIWKAKYGEYRQHDLLNIALQMFIDKYK
jgi:hypothetical protein